MVIDVLPVNHHSNYDCSVASHEEYERSDAELSVKLTQSCEELVMDSVINSQPTTDEAGALCRPPVKTLLPELAVKNTGYGPEHRATSSQGSRLVCAAVGRSFR